MNYRKLALYIVLMFAIFTFAGSDLIKPSGVTFPILAPDGTLAAPSYAFGSSTGVGIYKGNLGILIGNSNSVHSVFIGASGGRDYITLPGTSSQTGTIAFSNTVTEPTGGNVQGQQQICGGSVKTLTESAATGFVRITTTSNSRVGGEFNYSIECDDGTDFGTRAGVLAFNAVNKAGAITCTVGTPDAASEVVTTTAASTLTNTFTCADAGSNLLELRANATCSLTQTVLRIKYSVNVHGNQAVLVITGQ